MIFSDNTVYLGKAVAGSGGGAPVNLDKVIIKDTTIPTASAANVGAMYCYAGETNATYKHGYIYEGASIPANTATVTFSPATISCSGADFWDFWKGADGSPDHYAEIVKGEMILVGGNTWKLVGRNNNDEIVDSYQQYDEDWTALGFTFSGTFQEGDSVSYVCALNETGSTAYWWKRINVQPASGASSSSATPSVSFPSMTWFDNKTGTALATGLDLSTANLVKVYKNGVLLRPGDPLQYDTRYYPTGNDSRARIVLNNFIDFNSASSWKIEGVAKKTSSRNNWRLISNGLYDCTTPLLGGATTQWLVGLSSNGTSWDMYINNPSVLPDLTSEFNFDIGFTGTQYYADFNGTPFFSLNSTTKIYADSTRSRLALLNTAWDPDYAFPGYIVMNKFKVTLDNVVAFDGANADEVTDFTASYCTKEVVQVGGGGNDYNVSGGTINFETALQASDQIVVEVF